MRCDFFESKHCSFARDDRFGYLQGSIQRPPAKPQTRNPILVLSFIYEASHLGFPNPLCAAESLSLSIARLPEMTDLYIYSEALRDRTRSPKPDTQPYTFFFRFSLTLPILLFRFSVRWGIFASEYCSLDGLCI